MNIFLGAGGTGKSTLLRALQKKNPSLVGIESPSRAVKEVTRKADIDAYTEQALINNLALYNFEQYQDNNNVILIRSLIDVAIYSEYFRTAETAMLWTHVNRYLSEPHVGRIFYFPIEFVQAEDGVRYDDDLNKEIDKRMQWALHQLRTPFTVVSGSVEERVELVLPLL
jgi:predicted ATPase